MWTDDTPVTVLGGLEGSLQGHFWTYIGYEQPYSVYDFTKSRSRDGPAKFLQGYAICFSVCIRTTRDWRKCCPTAGPQHTPRPFSPTVSMNHGPGPLALEPVALIAAPTPSNPGSNGLPPRTDRTLTRILTRVC
jgi:hypothetical protein